MSRTLPWFPILVIASLSLEGERRAGAAVRPSEVNEVVNDEEIAPAPRAAAVAQAEQPSPPGAMSRRATPPLGGGGAQAEPSAGPAAPLVVIESAPPPETNRTTATFRFAAPGVRAPLFRCAIDRGAATACTSPWTRQNLAEGKHTFRVQLVGPGRRALASSEQRWIVDVTPPVAAITGGPRGAVDSSSAIFSFTLGSSDDLAECRVLTSSEMPPLRPCTSPYTAASLRGGPATFELRVRDRAGNDLTLTRAFTVGAPGDGALGASAGGAPRS